MSAKRLGRTLPSPESDDVPDGYDELMKRCFKHKANQRPLIDVVRDNLQDLLERAAEIDRKKTVHLELTREGSLARSRMLFEMMGGHHDIEEETKSAAVHRQSSKTNRNRTESRLRRHSTGSSLQGNRTGSVQIEMGTFSSSIDGSGFGLDSKEAIGETPFKL